MFGTKKQWRGARAAVLAGGLLSTVALVVPANAGTVTIDFSQFAAGNEFISAFTTDGFSFSDDPTSSRFVSWGTIQPSFNANPGGTALFANTLTPVVMTPTVSSFSITSIDLGSAHGIGESDFATNVDFTGTLEGGGTVTEDFAVGPAQLVTTYDFGSNFTDLISLSWLTVNAQTGQTDFGDQFTNLVIQTPSSTVPEPSTLALLGLGLVGLRFSSRRTQRDRSRFLHQR